MFRRKIQHAAALVLAASLFAASCPAAVFAESGVKMTEVRYPAAELFVGGEKMQPRDANGAAAEPFVLDGTLYLPLRAVCESLGFSLHWDGENAKISLVSDQTRTASGESSAAAESQPQEMSGAGAESESDNRSTVIEATYADIQIERDGEICESKNALGLNVEPFTVNGSTYLPLSALEKIVGSPIRWNSRTRRVYIGEIPADIGYLTETQLDALIKQNVPVSDRDETVVMTLGDYEIPYSEYRYYYINYVRQFIAYYGADYAENSQLAQMFEEYLTEGVKMNKLVAEAAKSCGVGLTREELEQTVFAVYDNLQAQLGCQSEEELWSFLDEYYAVTPYCLVYIEQIYQTYLKLYDRFYGIDGERSEEIRRKTLDDMAKNDIVRAKHILLSFPENAEGDAASEEQVYEQALAIYEKAKAGEDFDALIEEYGEDPGMSTYPAGYYFGKGEMVEPFEDAVYALEIGEISEPVRTTYGYHIILRLPLDDGDLVTSETYTAFAYDDFDAFFDNFVTQTELIPAANFEELIAPIYAEAAELIANA